MLYTLGQIQICLRSHAVRDMLGFQKALAKE